MLAKLKLLLEKLEIVWDKLEEEQKKYGKQNGINSFLGQSPTNINGLPLDKGGFDMEGNIYGTTRTEDDE